jgi:hypothetical protein
MSEFNVGDLVEYQSKDLPNRVGLVLEMLPSNVYDAATCHIFWRDGRINYVRKTALKKLLKRTELLK